MNYYLGIDAGGSKTYAMVTDESGRIVGKGSAGSGNHQTGKEAAETNLSLAAETALRQAGIGKRQLAYSFFGLAGADRKPDFDILHPIIRKLGFDRYTIVCDTLISLRAGTSRPYGVSVICGTGTNSAGISPSGEMYQCGGFDYMYGDFGGGGSLCIEVFRSVIRAWDGREKQTELTPLLLQLLDYESVEHMYHDYLDHQHTVPLQAAQLLFTAAAKGDPVSLDILNRQGKSWANR
ncbi:N-acetylglucosamine kinase [Paenibacillus beijingensis]|uniref:N-acetylglucosamine kinase n=1 Tax=Paenibacillus beijingensis TaxID=1126833 RepID=UPI000AABEBF7